jgi:predicted HicB family RNase H-like nuclease
MIKKTSVNIDEELWRKAKVKAAQEGKTICEVVAKKLTEYVEESV